MTTPVESADDWTEGDPNLAKNLWKDYKTARDSFLFGAVTTTSLGMVTVFLLTWYLQPLWSRHLLIPCALTACLLPWILTRILYGPAHPKTLLAVPADRFNITDPDHDRPVSILFHAGHYRCGINTGHSREQVFEINDTRIRGLGPSNAGHGKPIRNNIVMLRKI